MPVLEVLMSSHGSSWILMDPQITLLTESPFPGNVMVQTTLTVLLEDLTSGLIAVMGSTFSIVVFG